MNNNQGGNIGGLSHDQLQQLNQRFKNKDDIYDYLETVLQLLLPKKKNCPLRFMQDILTQRKRYLRRFEQRRLKLPKWPELSIARVMPEA